MRTLVVEVLEGRDLVKCTKTGDSDPNLAVFLTDLATREVKKESFKCKPQSKTLAPRWGEKFTFGYNYNLDTDGELPSLNLVLTHKATFSTSDVPMGEIHIDLDTVDPSGEASDMWYPLNLSGRMKIVTGELHLRISFDRPITPSEVPMTLEDEADMTEEEKAELEELRPNELHVTVVQGRRLEVKDKSIFGGGSSDPQVKLKIEGFDSQKTPYIRKSVYPVWNSKHVFTELTDSSLSLIVTVEDHNDIKGASFMGRYSIPLGHFDDKKPVKKWYKLRNRTMVVDGVDRGEVEVMLHWKFSMEVLESISKKKEAYEKSTLGKLAAFGGKLAEFAGGSGSESDPGSDDELDKITELERPQTEEEKEDQKKKEEEQRKVLSDIQIKDGDYQIQVHIIEARDLKAENMDGTSDPVVFVECFGQKQNTIVINQVTSCVYDELLIFDMKRLDKETFEDGLLRIACYDSNSIPFAGNTMIGAYAIDASMIYTMNKQHELYRAWVPLMDDEDKEDVGVQGYLKISIQIIGPGEKLYVHDEAAELAAEIKRENAVGGDVGSLCLSTPTIRKEWKFVVASIYRCEGLPVMDGKVGMGIATLKEAGTDAFCKYSFAGGHPIKTKVVTRKGKSRGEINPDFNYEMWYPVSVPTMTQVVRFSVWDKDPTESELIGQVVERYNRLDRLPGCSTDVQWYNMYGAPEFKNDKLLSNIKKGAMSVAKAAQQTINGDIDYVDYYNNVPDKATAFKGRCLMRWRIESRRPEKYDKPEMEPFKRRIKRIKRVQEPPCQEYVLQALVLSGIELPSFGTITSQSLRIQISMGTQELSTRPAKFENGQCRWLEFVQSDKFPMPLDVSQIPDIFVHLVKDDMKPVCFTRLKPVVDKQGTLMGFDQGAEWYLLQEDKSIDALNTGVFPGNVLLKVGFGTAEESEKRAGEWRACLDSAKKASPYQVRVHMYQARDLPAADANGLCDPYVKVVLNGQVQKTKTVKKNRYPGYYQTLIFDDVMIPEHNNFEYATQITYRLYDYDLDGDDYLGTCSYSMQDSVVTANPDAELPTPSQWSDFFYETPGDSTGQLLTMVQLIPTLGKQISRDPAPIVPDTRKAYLELILIGIRHMSPYNFQAMQSPFLQFELNSFGSTYLLETASSKRPDPSNPNFLEKIVMPVMLPEHSVFSSPLQVRARDTRLGGWLKPVVGVCQIDMSTKIPWCEETYIAPATDIFYQPVTDRGGAGGLGGGLDPASVKEQVAEMERQRQAEAEDEFVAMPEPVSIAQYLKGKVTEEDTGAGVFGALNYIDASGGSKKKKTASDAFADPDWSQDDGDQPPDWAVGRKKLAEELEVELQTTPFETYSLMRGSTKGMMGSTLKVVGKLKGLVRVMLEEDEEPLLSPELMAQLLKPEKYVVRLYCLAGKGLAAMDFNMAGQPANSDPYLKVSLGKESFNDRENYVEDVKDVDLYKLITFNCELPGTSQLQIALWDADLIGSDDLIGKTTIDLEDRWFDARWQKLGEENVLMPGADANDPTKVRWQTKPIERRSIYIPSKTLGQGVLELWVDIMTPEVSSAFPPDDVTLPPTQTFEVRVVIWKCKNVPPMDSLEGMSDLFVKCWPEGCKPAETDTHWRAKKGKSSYNYRLLFDVELGHSTRAMKFPYLHLQLWDRDILKWNDCAGEGTINLGRYYRKAYKRNLALKLFETKKGAAARRDNQTQSFQRAVPEDTEEDIPFEEEKEEEKEEEEVTMSPLLATEGDTKETKAVPRSQRPDFAPIGQLMPKREERDSDDEDSDEEMQGAMGVGMGGVGKNNILPNQPLRRKKKKEEKEVVVERKKATTSRFAWMAFWRKKQEPDGVPLLDESGEPMLDAEGQPMMEEEEEEEKEEDEDGELKSLISSFKNMTGLWDLDPEDSAWYHLETKDRDDPTIVTPMGSICYSVQIWPKDKALVMPSGAGRSEPNSNPFCPPPVGRFKFSWNPFVLGSELCGPALCAQLFCCLICLGFLALMIFCQPALNIIINLVFLVY